jgi:polysaccharide pyruvyl transferase WcaK-like protein
VARKILILAGDITGNIGDMGIARSTFEAFSSQIRDAQILFVADRDKAHCLFAGAGIIPQGLLGLGALIKAMLASDLVVVGGGGLFQDDDSLIKMPYWALRVALAKALGAEVVGYCLGVGPLKHPLSRVFARLAFACMSVISVRDPVACQVASGLTRQTVAIVPDPALSLNPAPPETAETLLRMHGVPRDGSPLVGVAVRKWFHRRGSLIPHKIAFRLGLGISDSRNQLNRMTDQLAGMLDRIASSHGAHMLFLPTYNVAHEGDDRVCEDIAAKMQSNRKSVLRISDPRLYKAVTGKLRVMLGARMHPTIFAAGMGIPVVGLAYNPKFKGFFQLIGCPDRLIPIEDFVEKKMTGKLLALMEQSLRLPRDSGATVVSGLVQRYHDFNSGLACMLQTSKPVPAEQQC